MRARERGNEGRKKVYEYAHPRSLDFATIQTPPSAANSVTSICLWHLSFVSFSSDHIFSCSSAVNTKQGETNVQICRIKSFKKKLSKRDKKDRRRQRGGAFHGWSNLKVTQWRLYTDEKKKKRKETKRKGKRKRQGEEKSKSNVSFQSFCVEVLFKREKRLETVQWKMSREKKWNFIQGRKKNHICQKKLEYFGHVIMFSLLCSVILMSLYKKMTDKWREFSIDGGESQCRTYLANNWLIWSRTCFDARSIGF